MGRIKIIKTEVKKSPTNCLVESFKLMVEKKTERSLKEHERKVFALISDELEERLGLEFVESLEGVNRDEIDTVFNDYEGGHISIAEFNTALRKFND